MILTLTPDPVTATITVAATGLVGAQAILTRTDVNGTHTVLRRVGHTIAGGAITVVDHDPARHSLVRYRVQSRNSGAILSDGTATTTLSPGPDPGPRLHLPVQPHHDIPLLALTDLAPSIRSGYTAHEVIGRLDPVLMLAPAKAPTGRLTIRAVDAAGAYAALDAYAQGDVAMLRMSDPGGARDLWHLAESADLAPQHTTTTGRYWDITVSYLQVPAPAGPILGEHPWTFAELEAYGTFEAVAAGFADLDDAAEGT